MGLTRDQIAAVARAAGFPDSVIDTAVAVALAESGGNPLAEAKVSKPKPGFKPEISRGLWQINILAHPWAATMNLFDPAVNAVAAYRVSAGGRNWRPWTTYVSGAYKAFLSKLPTIPFPALGLPLPAALTGLNPWYVYGAVAIAFLLAILWLKEENKRV